MDKLRSMLAFVLALAWTAPTAFACLPNPQMTQVHNGFNMSDRSRELREELSRLMEEQLASLKKERFGGLTPSEMRENEERLKRIREVSADYIFELKRNNP